MVKENVKEYYGKILQGSNDLKTNACCTGESFPPELKKILKEIDDEIVMKFYGCGSPIPEVLEGKTVLDLGCGSGRDVYLLSKLVGSCGSVIGVDMTEEQLAVARRHQDSMAKKFCFEEPNTDFRKGYIEDLKAMKIADNSVDVVVSNCVINLSPDKKSVFSEIFRVLKSGGELYFSDVFSGRRIPEGLREDPVLHGECLGGALYMEDFRRMMLEIGFPEFRLTEQRRITVDNAEVEMKIGMVDFYSMTVRAFKLDEQEDVAEDYGQIAIYKGTIPGHPHFFKFDVEHTFLTGKPTTVCGNSALMLQNTRFAEHFTVSGDRSTHFGPFDASAQPLQTNSLAEESSGCC